MTLDLAGPTCIRSASISRETCSPLAAAGAAATHRESLGPHGRSRLARDRQQGHCRETALVTYTLHHATPTGAAVQSHPERTPRAQDVRCTDFTATCSHVYSPMTGDAGRADLKFHSLALRDYADATESFCDTLILGSEQTRHHLSGDCYQVARAPSAGHAVRVGVAG